MLLKYNHGSYFFVFFFIGGVAMVFCVCMLEGEINNVCSACDQHSTVSFANMGEGKVCDTCGNIGFEGALVTCTQCKVGCEHLYCLRNFCMVVPADWCCEMCRSTNIASSDHSLKKDLSEPLTCNLSTELPKYPKEFTDRKKLCKGARGNWHEKAVGKGKTKYLWTNEVKNMPSGEKKGDFTHVGPISSQPSKSDYSMSRMKPKSISNADSSHLVKSNSEVGPSRYSQQLHPTRSGNTQNKTSVPKFKEMKSIVTPVKEHLQMRQTSSVKDIKSSNAKKQKEMGEAASASEMSRRRQTCDIPQTDVTLSPAIALPSAEVMKRPNGHLQKTISKEPCEVCQSSMSGNVVFTVKEFFTKAAAEKPLPTDPALDASWTGRFILKDEETSMSLQAYTTSDGLSKVREFSKRMPEVLEFELFSYENFLRTVFRECDPDDEDIGLYFFPDNKNSSSMYISHLEQLAGNCFLRSCIDGVELLVFTSKVLHKDYRKRNNCDFLWGLYRPRHRKLKSAVEETMVVDMDIDLEDVDMEVDMVGGEIIGPVDVVVPKPIKSDYDMPPGFSLSMRGQWNDIPPSVTAPIKIKKEVP